MRAYKVNDGLMVNIDAIAAVRAGDEQCSILLIGGQSLEISLEECTGLVAEMSNSGSIDKVDGEIDPENMMDYFRKGKFSMDAKSLNAQMPESESE